MKLSRMRGRRRGQGQGLGRLLHEVAFEQRLAGSEGGVTERGRPTGGAAGVMGGGCARGSESKGRRGTGARRAAPQAAGGAELTLDALELASPWKVLSARVT